MGTSTGLRRTAGRTTHARLGCGTIFKMTQGGTLTTLYSFCFQSGCAYDAQLPYAGLVQATGGDLYGTAGLGGAGGRARRMGEEEFTKIQRFESIGIGLGGDHELSYCTRPSIERRSAGPDARDRDAPLRPELADHLHASLHILYRRP